ncbi:depupylase/deamidase Dop [Granulicoccus phenolivorans]|uniref:depupylase/deamidase Dop n=1 Tax=Granulicoccus phenolivorans TaxID=266854 RepID=UPI000688BD5D|nr:depupylase/deamidase Dop [Granulicoccus phenolivorans]
MTVCGIETEYGISLEGDAQETHPMVLSNHAVRAYQALISSSEGPHWDFSGERPLTDARGFELERYEARADQLTDEPDATMANTVLSNGARFYVDHAHPEYSGPEVTSAADAVLWDRAGDQVLALAARAAGSRLGRTMRIYKNNTDGKGAAYGTHENYLMARQTHFHRVVRQFTGFLVTRTPLVGAGRVGIGTDSRTPGFQLSQRADFFAAEVGLETTVNRPIINTRDEPHADALRHRRLHVITGDANQSEFATWLKVGTAALTLRAIADDVVGDSVQLFRPVPAMHAVSHDLDFTVLLKTLEGRQLTALDLQEQYADAVAAWLARDPELAHPEEARDLLTAWRATIAQLRQDPMQLADRLDWVTKLQLLESYRRRDGLDWSAAKLALVDLQYADVDPDRSLYHALRRKGRLLRLVTDAEVARARTQPPDDTRAYFRGRVVDRFGDQVRAASWDSVVLQVPGRRNWLRIPTLDPLRGTRALVGDVVDQAADVGDLVTRLGL